MLRTQVPTNWAVTFRAMNRHGPHQMAVFFAGALLVVAATVGGTRTAAVAQGPEIAQGPVGSESRRLYVKLRDADRIRLRGSVLQSIPAEGAVIASEASDRRSHLVQLLVDGTKGVRIRRLFSRSEASLDDEHNRLVDHGSDVANLNSFVEMDVPVDQDIERFASALRRIPGVDEVGGIPSPAPLPSPDFTSYLGYRFASGVDAPLPAVVPGSSGSNVTIADVEYSWNQNHEDLAAASGVDVLLANGTPVDPFNDTNHGTAVLGVLAGTADQQGVTGLAPQARIRLVNANTSAGYYPADAVSIAHSALGPGDVILIEQQVAGPSGCGSSQFGCVPVEWFLPVYEAIRAATADGIIVVEAAANGSQNLDDRAVYGYPFPAGRADSGAIVVGASSHCFGPGSRMSYSDYGLRVDMNAAGQCVATTGYGDLYNSGSNAQYTSQFSGTSSASSIVAGAAAVVSSVAKQQGVTLSPNALRQLLKETGTTLPAETSIGPLVKVRAALYRFVPTARLVAPPSVRIRRTFTLDASATVDPQGSPVTFSWDLNGDDIFGDATTPVVSLAAPSSPGNLTVSVRVSDPFGATDEATAVIEIVPEPRAAAPSAPVDSTVPERIVAPTAGPATTLPRGPAPSA